MRTEYNKWVTPTDYDGHHFRSRTEAKWAVFFNEMGIKYEFEPKTFMFHPDEIGEMYIIEPLYTYDAMFPDKTKHIYYKPDFYLPDYDVWAEVKPTEFTRLEDGKLYLLVNKIKGTCIRLVSFPKHRVYLCETWHKGHIYQYYCYLDFKDNKFNYGFNFDSERFRKGKQPHRSDKICRAKRIAKEWRFEGQMDNPERNIYNEILQSENGNIYRIKEILNARLIELGKDYKYRMDLMISLSKIK